LRDAGNMLEITRETRETCWKSFERRRKHAGGHFREVGNMLEIT